MKGLKIFGWICFGMGLVCFVLSHAVEWLGLPLGYFYDEYASHCLVVALVFFVAAVLSWLVSRALKEIKNDLELKMLMQS